MPFDFDAAVNAPFRMQPGLRRIAPGADQLTPNAPGDRALVEKLAVLRGHASQALIAMPGFDATPAVQKLAAHAATEQRGAFAWDGDLGFVADRLGWSLQGDAVHGHGPAEIGACLRALPPAWRLPALLCLAFAEDFAVLDAATSRIPWLAVCLPSHWAPEDKLGRHFAEVHAPVADNRLLIAAGDHLARLVTGAEHWERFVWTLTPQPRLDGHPRRSIHGGWPPDLGADALAARAFFRTERQTFIPVAAQRQAVFTIHVESAPLAAALATREQATRLHDALASMSAAVLRYRGLEDAQGRLLQWLAAEARRLPA